eukprot:1147280-Pelagomonas_calceolata.AAC.9
MCEPGKCVKAVWLDSCRGAPLLGKPKPGMPKPGKVPSSGVQDQVFPSLSMRVAPKPRAAKCCITNKQLEWCFFSWKVPQSALPPSAVAVVDVPLSVHRLTVR